MNDGIPQILLLGFTGDKRTQITQLLAEHACQLQVRDNVADALNGLAQHTVGLVLVDSNFWHAYASDISGKVQPLLNGISLFVVISDEKEAINVLQQGDVALLNLQWSMAAQQQLDQHFALIQHVCELRADVTRSTEEKYKAEAASKSKTRFLAIASHDLRQPVHSLQLLIEVLKNRLADEPRNLEIVQHIRASTKGLSELLDTLLELSKLDAGMVKPILKPLRLKRLLGEVCQDLLPQAQEKNLRLSCYSREFLINSDEQLFKRMLRNLVHNAIRYTEAGRVFVGTRQMAGQIEVQVWDTGSGIAKQNQEKIFQEFVQLGDTEKNGANGMGLGLSSVQKSAELLGYSIRLDSCEGKGTMFALCLPFIPVH